MNKVILMGRLTKDVEVRYTTNNNTLVAYFPLAVNRRFKHEGQPDADFINIIAWDKTGEFCSNYFKKGLQVGVVGRIQTRNYDDKDGKKIYVTEVVAEEVYFADTKHEEKKEENNPFGNTNYNNPFAGQGQANDFKPVTNDDLPF